MPNRGEIYRKVIAQATLRGLDAEESNGLVLVRYPQGVTDREDNLHKQSIRSLIKKLDPEGQWKIHIIKLGESGFTVEVRPAPGTETYEAVPPGPAINGEIDLNDSVQVSDIAAKLRALADELEGVA